MSILQTIPNEFSAAMRAIDYHRRCRNRPGSAVMGTRRNLAMHYSIFVYESEAELAARSDPKRKDAYWGAYRAYTEALRAAGVMVGGAGLEPPRAATTVRQSHGTRQV